MILVFLKRLLQMAGLVALQVLVCNHIHFLGYATPMLYVLFVVWLPLNASRVGNLLWAFVLGLLIDIFSNTPGEAAASLTLTAFVQWPLLQLMAPKESTEDMVPSYQTMGRWNHVRYILLLTLVHHAAFYLLESFSFFHAREVLVAFGASVWLSFLLMLVLETLRHGK
ncbi:MAG: rod shape-determining protein MreD [Bacteroidaceae bacterium]|nr:rod shape-determining protein MreD [Bacteroidaceae bacterium]MDE6633981.1 rod shape-determining protein MreD [Bacteroidaceae bacterium]MDE7166930.1 rod shape-determining protein MreD [Bacteroidaceae bacterium]